MPSRPQITRNILVNWAAMLAGMLVPFFLSPFTVHHLGMVGYGIWILIMSSVSYFNLLDLGLRSAIVRFVSKSFTLGRHEESREVVAAALWLRLGIGLLMLVCGLLLAWGFPRIFKVPGDLRSPAQYAVVITSVSLACTLAFGVASGVLAAIHRFDLLGGLNIVRALMRAGGAVWLLLHGHGIVSLSVWELVTAISIGLATSGLCLRTYPELGRRIGRPDLRVMRNIWGYGVYVAIAAVAGAVVYHTDNIVVGVFLSAAAVTFYAIAGNLVLYAREAVAAVSTTFVPMASGYEAVGEAAKLKLLLLRGTRASLFLSFPVCLALFFRGHTFISLWMGSELADVPSRILQILLINQILLLGNTTAGGVAYGMEKHKPIAKWAVCEAGLNLVLSCALVRVIGIYGVAWGTVIPGLFINLVCWPRYVQKLLGISALEYVVKAWSPAALAAIPFAAACYWEEQHLASATLLQFFAQVLAILPIYGGASFWMFRKEVTPIVRRGWARAWSGA